MTKYIIHIRSKDTDQLSPGLNTHFNVNLKQPIECGLYNKALVSIISAEIPYSFYCVSHLVQNDKFYYDNTHFTLPRQNYNVTELIRVLDLNTPFTCSFNEFTCKLSFTNNDTSSHTINISLSNSAQLLGIQNDGISYTVLAGATFTPKGILDLASVHSVLIRSDLASGNIQSSLAGNSTVLQKIPVNVNPYEIVYLGKNDSITESVISTHIIDSINFRLTDQNNNLLDMNSVNYEFTLQIELSQNDESNAILPVEFDTKNELIEAEITPVKNDDDDVNVLKEHHSNEESLLDILLED